MQVTQLKRIQMRKCRFTLYNLPKKNVNFRRIVGRFRLKHRKKYIMMKIVTYRIGTIVR